MDRHSDPSRAPTRPKIRLDPVGFWSYARDNEDLSEGRLAGILRQIKAELASRFGRLEIFQDTSTIRHGEAWETRIREWIERSTFFIPILTPHFILSERCMDEVEWFLAREQQLFDTHPDLPRTSRIFPIHYVDIDGAASIRPDLVTKLVERNWFDMREMRYAERVDIGPAGRAIGEYAKSIRDLLMIEVTRPLTAEEMAAAAEESARMERDRITRETEAAELARAKGAELAQQAAQNAAVAAARAADEAAARQERSRLRAEQLKRNRPWIAGGMAVAALAAAVVFFVKSQPDPGPLLVPEETTINDITPSPQPQTFDWLLGRWGIDGNCDNPTIITFEADRPGLTTASLAVTTAGSTDRYSITSDNENEVVANGATFIRVDSNRLKIKYSGYEPEFSRCQD